MNNATWAVSLFGEWRGCRNVRCLFGDSNCSSSSKCAKRDALQLSASTDTADTSTSDGDAVTSIRHSGDGKCVNITLNISTDSK